MAGPMTSLLLSVLGFFLAYAIYVATLTARQANCAEDYLDGGRDLPGWCFVFAGTGLLLSAIGLYDHYLLLALFGLQYNHIALGIVLAAMAGAIVQKRLWLAARITGLKTLGDLLGAYYGSTALRVLLLILLLLFALPFAAQSLGRLGLVVETASQGQLPRAATIWIIATFLFLGGVIGGWRAVVYVIAGQSVLFLTLIALTAGVGAVALDWTVLLGGKMTAGPGVLAQEIPGVIQYSAGLGKETASGGIWTTTAILSTALSLVGIVLSPAFVFLAITTGQGRGFAFKQVWMTSGLGIAALLLLTPLIAVGLGLAAPDALAEGLASYAGLLAQLMTVDQLYAVGFALLLVAALQIPVSVFAQSGASLFVIELFGRFVIPGLTQSDRRLAARVSLAAIYLLIAALASFAPLWSEVVGTMTLSLSLQLFPAILGLCWVRWISRGAVLTGLIFGILLVVFTEPLGLILFEGLFVELPWGRWPLTIHSAAWGLVFNLAACLLVSIFTLRAPDRANRDRLHDVFERHHKQRTASPALRTALWSLIAIWAFFGLGPGAILGNWFFSEPIFADTALTLAVPSLWIWQVVFWFLGVFFVWWLAYQARLSIVDRPVEVHLSLDRQRSSFAETTPGFFVRILERLARR
ncbi:MAG: hypothetical protein Kilf2KO_23900 [Rhodospirillales bacterium]